jgi:hypothetical protein
LEVLVCIFLLKEVATTYGRITSVVRNGGMPVGSGSIPEENVKKTFDK